MKHSEETDPSGDPNGMGTGEGPRSLRAGAVPLPPVAKLDQVSEPRPSARARRTPGIRVTRTSDEVFLVAQDADAGQFKGFFERAFDWFWSRPEMLPLDEAQLAAARSDESARFRETMRKWAREGIDVPAEVGVTYASLDKPRTKPTRPNLPPPVQGDAYAAIGGLERRGISAFVLHAADDSALIETERGLTYEHEERLGTAEVTFVPAVHDVTGMPVTREQLAELRSLVADFGPLDEDVLEILGSNVIENPSDPDGLHTITVDGILDARGITPKTKGGLGDKKFRAGHKQEQRESVNESFEKLRRVWLESSPVTRKDDREIQTFTPVLIIHSKDVDVNTGDVVSIKYQFGAWFHRWREGMTTMPRRVLEYHSRKSKLAKNVARYVVQRRHECDGDRRLIRRIRTLLADLGEQVDVENPKRTRQKLELSLKTLVADGIFEEWEYLDDPLELPRYGWIDAWLALRIGIRLRPLQALNEIKRATQ